MSDEGNRIVSLFSILNTQYSYPELTEMKTNLENYNELGSRANSAIVIYLQLIENGMLFACLIWIKIINQISTAFNSIPAYSTAYVFIQKYFFK